MIYMNNKNYYKIPYGQLLVDVLGSCYGKAHRNFHIASEGLKATEHLLADVKESAQKVFSSQLVEDMFHGYDCLIIDDDKTVHVFSELVHGIIGHRILNIIFFIADGDKGYAVIYTLYEGDIESPSDRDCRVVCLTNVTEQEELDKIRKHALTEVLNDKDNFITDSYLRYYLDTILGELKEQSHPYTNTFSFTDDEFSIITAAFNTKFYDTKHVDQIPIPGITFECGVVNDDGIASKLLPETVDTIHMSKTSHWRNRIDLAFDISPVFERMDYFEMIGNRSFAELKYKDVFASLHNVDSFSMEYPFSRLSRDSIRKQIWYNMRRPLSVTISHEKNKESVIKLGYTFNGWGACFAFTVNDDAMFASLRKFEVSYYPLNINGFKKNSNEIYDILDKTFFDESGYVVTYAFEMVLGGLLFIYDKGDSLILMSGRTKKPRNIALIDEADVDQYLKIYDQYNPKKLNISEKWYEFLESIREKDE